MAIMFGYSYNCRNICIKKAVSNVSKITVEIYKLNLDQLTKFNTYLFLRNKFRFKFYKQKKLIFSIIGELGNTLTFLELLRFSSSLKTIFKKS